MPKACAGQFGTQPNVTGLDGLYSIQLTAVRSRTQGETVVLRITTFSDQTYPSMREQLAEQVEELGGMDNVNGFVLDLRNNPGGLLTQAIREYVRRRRVRPDVMGHLGDSMSEEVENDKGKLVTKALSRGRTLGGYGPDGDTDGIECLYDAARSWKLEMDVDGVRKVTLEL